MTVLTSNAYLELPKIVTLAKGFICTGLIFVMLNVPLLNKCYWVAIFLILMSSAWKKEWQILLKDPIIWVGILLVILFTVGLFDSYGSLKYGLRAWDKYLKILYLFFFLPIFKLKEVRNQALFCFLCGVMLNEGFTYLHSFGLISFGFPQTQHWLFVQNIDGGYIVSLASFIFANLAMDNKKYRWLFIACLFICSIDILIFNSERTGYLIYLGLAGLFFLQRFKWKGLLSTILVVPLLFFALYFGSHQFNDRVTQIVTNVVDYQKGNEGTSIGLRLAFAKYSINMIKHHLLFGLGTGSFQEIYRSLNGPKINGETYPAHPHNEYIYICFQAGLTGLLLFVYWIVLQIMASFKLPQQEKFLVQGVIAGFLLLGLCNASLSVNPAGACYLTFLAIFLAAKYEHKRTV